MANKMTVCKACGKEVAKGAKACPNCGKDSRNFFEKHKIISGILVLIVLVGVGSGLGNNDGNDKAVAASTTSPASTTSTSTQAVNEEKAAPIVVTADTLVKALDDNALNAANTYKDKYVEVSGKLSNIDSSGAYFSISSTSDDFSFTTIRCDITEEQKSKVAAFKSGQKVTVVGTVTDVGEILGYAIDVESIK